MWCCRKPEPVASALAAALVTVSGCSPVTDLWSKVVSLLTSEPVADVASCDEIEPNDEVVATGASGSSTIVRLRGAIQPGDDLDCDAYDLGPGEAGDRMHVDLDPHGSDIQVGLFNERFELLGVADGTSRVAAGRQAEIVLHHAVPRILAVATTRSTASTDRPYDVEVTISPDGGPPPSRPQIVILHFQGAGQVIIGSRPPVDVPPFDVATIDPRLAGQTEAVIARVIEKVRQDFAGLSIEFYLTGDTSMPSNPRIIIYYGTSSDLYLGLAEDLDPLNRHPLETAIIYTDNFSLFRAFSPGVEGIAQALANTTSHELGHLFSLKHTADAHELMSITASARELLADQAFGIARLDPSVMSVGVQNAPSLLAEALGGELVAPPAGEAADSRRKMFVPSAEDDFYIARSMLAADSRGVEEASAEQSDAETGY